MEDEPVAKRLRHQSVNIQENQLHLQSPPSSSSSSLISRQRSRSVKKIQCFPGKQKTSKCYKNCNGPNCIRKQIPYMGGTSENFGRSYCSEKCKNEDDQLIFENAAPLEFPYCICRKGIGGEMIACDQKGCPNEWYHLECLGIIKVPSGKWVCPECKIPETKKSKNSVTFADDTSNQIQTGPDKMEDQNVDLSEGYCNCLKKPDAFMTECSSPQCPGKFFHLSCVNLKDFPDPEMDWCCSKKCLDIFNSLV